MTSDSPGARNVEEMRHLAGKVPDPLRAVLDLVPGWFWTTGPDHRFTWFSTGFEAYTGDPPEAFLGRSRMDYLRRIGVEDRAVARHVADIDAHRPFRNFVYPTVFARGETWLCVGGMPVREPDGRFAGYRGMAMPIDAVMARAELAMPEGADLRERASRLQRTLRERTDALGDAHVLMQEVVESVDQGIIVSDWRPAVGGRIEMVNRRFGTLTGVPQELLRVGAPIAPVIDWVTQAGIYGDDAAAVTALKDRIYAGEPCLLPGGTPAGRRLLIRRRARPGGGAVSTLTDVTALEAARRAAAAAAEARAAFLKTMSHEFRTPMNGVLGMADVLARELPRGEMHECAAILLDAATAMARLLDDVIEYADGLGVVAGTCPDRPGDAAPAAVGGGADGSSAMTVRAPGPDGAGAPPRGAGLPGAGWFELPAARAAAYAAAMPHDRADGPAGALTPTGAADGVCDVVALARDALGSAGGELRRKGLRASLAVADGLEPRRHVDAERLGRALAALVGNAAKFTEAGAIAIRLAEDGTDGLRIEVVDTGPGIPAALHARIWEGFSQGEGGLARRHGGIGLGLPLARRMVEALGGRATLDSAPSEGARFTLVLPAPAATRAD